MTADARADGRPVAQADGRAERGSASVWLPGLCAVLGLAIVAAVLVGSGALVRHRAGSAADLAALAAAGAAFQGEAAACAQARVVTTGMAADLAGCHLTGLVAQVDVTVTARLWIVGQVSSTGRARAGPVAGP